MDQNLCGHIAPDNILLPVAQAIDMNINAQDFIGKGGGFIATGLDQVRGDITQAIYIRLLTKEPGS
ncbi:MAG: hypothetical protein COA81_07680 [Alphaproteobacteria bacterium]|nr:MAG: hypothetical protein COA81_07680 [Alphaproteobacteria bacterium]